MPVSAEAKMVRDFIVPPIIALILGGVGAWVGVRVAVAEQAVAIAGVTTSLSDLKATVTQINLGLQATSISQATMAERVRNLEARVVKVER